MLTARIRYALMNLLGHSVLDQATMYVLVETSRPIPPPASRGSLGLCPGTWREWESG